MAWYEQSPNKKKIYYIYSHSHVSAISPFLPDLVGVSFYIFHRRSLFYIIYYVLCHQRHSNATTATFCTCAVSFLSLVWSYITFFCGSEKRIKKIWHTIIFRVLFKEDVLKNFFFWRRAWHLEIFVKYDFVTLLSRIKCLCEHDLVLKWEMMFICKAFSMEKSLLDHV